MVEYSINKNYRYYAALSIFFTSTFLVPIIKSAALSYGAISPQLISGISVVALIGAFWWVFDLWLWRIPGLLGMSFVPDFSGRWIGYIERRKSFDKVPATPGGELEAVMLNEQSHIPIEIAIKQTFTHISISLKSFEEGLGATMVLQHITTASISLDQAAVASLHYVFAKQKLIGESRLEMTRAGKVSELHGEYTSSHPRAGVMRLQRAKSKRSVWLVSKLQRMQSVSGEAYLGAVVGGGFLGRFLQAFKSKCGRKQYMAMRDRQVARDGAGFHITVVEPGELASLSQEIPISANWKALGLGSLFWFRLDYLGCAKAGDDITYFVIASSGLAQDLRRSLGLSEKHLHVTLGFRERDLHNVNKGPDSRV